MQANGPMKLTVMLFVPYHAVSVQPSLDKLLPINDRYPMPLKCSANAYSRHKVLWYAENEQARMTSRF